MKKNNIHRFRKGLVTLLLAASVAGSTAILTGCGKTGGGNNIKVAPVLTGICSVMRSRLSLKRKVILLR